MEQKKSGAKKSPDFFCDLDMESSDSEEVDVFRQWSQLDEQEWAKLMERKGEYQLSEKDLKRLHQLNGWRMTYWAMEGAGSFE